VFDLRDLSASRRGGDHLQKIVEWIEAIDPDSEPAKD
jgi:hypothetical protein